MNDHDIVLAIQELMDGTEWSADTLDAVASILEGNGYHLSNYEEEDVSPCEARAYYERLATDMAKK